MPDILHRVGIAATPDAVYEAVATRQGLTGWWTRKVEGDDAEGGKLQFFFQSPEPSAVMEVVRLTPGRQVTWSCVEGPDEWVGTTVTFDVVPTEGETVLLFTHAGWRESVEFMHHCSTKWGYHLLGLKSGLETGKSTPFPEDEKISSWG